MSGINCSKHFKWNDEVVFSFVLDAIEVKVTSIEFIFETLLYRRYLVILNLISTAEAKGRVERLFQTFQDRLIPEMRLRGITTISEANHYLKNDFLPGQYFELCRVEPENPEPAWRYPAFILPLEEILCLKYSRKILKNHTISWKNKYFDVVPPDGISIAGHSIEIRVYPSGLSATYYRRQRIELKEVPSKKGMSLTFLRRHPHYIQLDPHPTGDLT